jgi:hypothetical protein
MGMYDQFRLTRPPVETCETDIWYQSKDMGCDLVDYEVDADGQLWEIGLCEVPAPWGKEKINHTGEVRIGDTGIYDYALTFENGKLVTMRTLEPATKHDMLSMDFPQFHGRLNVSELKRFECTHAGLSTVLGCGQLAAPTRRVKRVVHSCEAHGG